MIIEFVDRDEVIVKDDTKKISNKRKFLISFHNGISHNVFDEEENTYKITLSRNNNPEKPEDLASCYDLVHEIHHLQESLLYPRWEAIRVFNLKPIVYDFPFDEYHMRLLSNDFKNRLTHLRDEDREKIRQLLREGITQFLAHVNSRPLPRPHAYLNAFEDLKIERHIDFSHSEIRKSPNFSSDTLDNFIKSFRELSKIIKGITGGFAIILQIPFTSYEELEDIYLFYDQIVILRNRISPEDYYKEYHDRLKKFKKREIPKKAYADRYRADLELKRVKSILKELKK